MPDLAQRAMHEIEHGKLLATGDTELIWGWGTAAGQRRAIRRATLIANGAHLKPGKRALEIGCGTGLFTELFAQSGAFLVAVDLSDELLAKARLRGLPTDRVEFLAKPFEACTVEGPFDAVIGSSVLHHLDRETAFPKIYQLLKPGGVISFAEPNMLNPQVFLERTCRQWFPYVSDDETAFVRWKLEEELAIIGFQQIEVTPFDWLHPAVPESLIPLIAAAGRQLECTPGLREFAGSLYIRAQRPKIYSDEQSS